MERAFWNNLRNGNADLILNDVTLVCLYIPRIVRQEPLNGPSYSEDQGLISLQSHHLNDVVSPLTWGVEVLDMGPFTLVWNLVEV